MRAWKNADAEPGGRRARVRGREDARGMTEGRVDVFTDGGCLGNPGVGAWAAVIYDGPRPEEVSGAERDTTSNRMEFRS